jgi:hypothetical protein
MMEVDAVQLGHAREWISDAFGGVDAWALQPLDVVRTIRRHYVGGIAQFVEDVTYRSVLDELGLDSQGRDTKNDESTHCCYCALAAWACPIHDPESIREDADRAARLQNKNIISGEREGS